MLLYVISVLFARPASFFTISSGSSDDDVVNPLTLLDSSEPLTFFSLIYFAFPSLPILYLTFSPNTFVSCSFSFLRVGSSIACTTPLVVSISSGNDSILPSISNLIFQ